MKIPHHTILEKMVCKRASMRMSIPSSMLYAVSVCIDLSDRKPSRELLAITILCLYDASRSTLGVVVGGGGWVWGGRSYFFPLLPLWDHCIIQETLTEPCTSLYIFGTKLDLPTSQKEKKNNRKTGSQPLKIHSELSVAHPSPSCSN